MRLRMKYSAMLILPVLPALGRAQAVSGFVTNGAGPVAGARVTLFSSDTSDFREARSAADGSFSFAPATGSYRLGAASVGRQYLEMNVTGGQTGITMSLAPETQPGR